MNSYSTIFVISGCIFSFFISFAIFLKPREDKRNYLEGAVFLLASLWMFCAYHRIFLGVQENNLFIIGTILFAFFVPFFYLYGCVLIDPSIRLEKRYGKLFVLPFLLLPVFLITVQYPQGFYTFTGVSPLSEKLRTGILTAATFVENFYLFIMLVILNIRYTGAIIEDRENAYRYLRFFFSCTLFLNIIIGFYFVNLFFDLKQIKYSYFFGTFLVYYFFAIYFVFFNEISARMVREKNQGENNYLKEVDVEKLIARLEELMREEKLYRIEDLTQRGLAERLGVSPQQLSAFFSSHLQSSYYAYLNTFRIEEAKALLVSEPAMKIIEIALHVGFNSQSSFYNAFKNATGSSPRQYRNCYSGN